LGNLIVSAQRAGSGHEIRAYVINYSSLFLFMQLRVERRSQFPLGWFPGGARDWLNLLKPHFVEHTCEYGGSFTWRHGP